MSKQKSKYELFREAIKNPPADRLAKIEYQSHFLQMVGVTFASIILFYKGLWYVVFAFIFMLGISYSQGMNAYRKYQNIKEFMPKENPKDYEKDISPSRRKGKIVEYVYGKRVKWFSIILSVIFSYLLIGVNFSWWIRSLIYPVVIFIFFYLMFFVLFYKIANIIYQKEVKGK